MSRSTSRATDSNCHGPRYGVRPAVLVCTTLQRKVAAGTRYGPGYSIPTDTADEIGDGVG